MPTLKIITENETKEIAFSGTPRLSEILIKEGYFLDSPCGGNGKCGKCAVRLLERSVDSGDLSPEWKTKLACKFYLTGDTTVQLPINYIKNTAVEDHIGEIQAQNADFKYGAALDIGTTTVALKLFSPTGEAVAEAVGINPQRSVSSDVIGRIDAAVNGKLALLNTQIKDCITALFQKVCNEAEIDFSDIEKTVITGNTAMLYLLCGLNPKSISVSPFISDNLFGIDINLPFEAYLPPCINAFVGADLVCSVVASGMCESDKTSLLCDIGTNGEIALWKNGRLYVTSAAAGPAFEGAEISCGCPCTNGAIYKVWYENHHIISETVNGFPAIGICGSGLIDAVSMFLEQGYIDAEGASASNLKLPSQGESIFITPDDIRALQLAKSAVYSAIETLLDITSTSVDEINRLYISGGFGRGLNLDSASKIGLIPEALKTRAIQMGNGALKGAAMVLFDEGIKATTMEISANAEHITLGGNEGFNKRFLKNISFG